LTAVHRRLPIAIVATALLSAACTGAEERAPSLDAVVDRIETVPSVERHVRLDEADDPEGLLGAPDGYAHGVLFHDARGRCSAPDISCGAYLEAWDDHDEAAARSEEVLALQSGMPMLGSERHYVEGRFLLRVSGDLPERSARQYAEALRGD
jgi:hypothetical protein